MKNLFALTVFFTLAILLLNTQLASAAHAAKVLATVETSGGMPGPSGMCFDSHLDVLDTGEVVQTKCSKDPQVVVTLASAIVADIISDEAQLSDLGQLQALNPSAPECADAPSTIYSALTSTGKFTNVGGIINCRKVGPKLTTFEASELEGLLESLTTISRF